MLKVCHTEALSIINENGICIRYIYPTFYDGGRDEYIVLTLHKIEDTAFELLSIELSVPCNHPCIRDKPLDKPCDFLQVFGAAWSSSRPRAG